MVCRAIKFLIILVLLQLSACSSLMPAPLDASAELSVARRTPWVLASTGGDKALAWSHYKLPGKAPSQFKPVPEGGRDAMEATAQSSVSLLRQMLNIHPADLGQLKFSWKVPALIAQADMAVRDTDDSPVRIVLAFDGDKSQFSAKNAALSELAKLLTGEEMPYATLMYVWCNKREPGSVIENPRSDRIRKLVVESGSNGLNQWLDYERSIRLDFEKAFGEAPGRLMSIAIMTDTDNTKSFARAWYGPVQLLTKAP
jgi:hypothetical protein